MTLHDLQVHVEPLNCWTDRDCSTRNVRIALTQSSMKTSSMPYHCRGMMYKVNRDRTFAKG